jgi:hypothetical protein
MSLIVGENGALLLAKEVTYGTAVARTIHLPLISHDMKVVDAPLARQHLRRATGGIALGHYRSRRDAGGPCKVEMYYSGSGLIWLGLMGSVTDTGAGPYTHTYKLENELPSLTGEIIRGDGRQTATELAEVFKGCVLNQGSIQCESGGFMTADLTVLAQDANDRAAPTAYVGDDGNLIRGDECGTLSWNGLTLTLRSVGLEINNGHVFRPRMGFKTTAQPTRANFREIKLRATLDQANDDVYQAYLDQDVGDAIVIFDGGGNETMTWTLHNCRLGLANGAVSGPGVITETIELLPQGDLTDRGLEVVIVNDVASGEA